MGKRKDNLGPEPYPVKPPEENVVDPPEAQITSADPADVRQRFRDSLDHQIYVPRPVRLRDAADFVQSLFGSGD